EGYMQEPDLPRAVMRYRQAADQGVAEAQYRLAAMIERGRGTARDQTEALKFYKASAEQGYALAQQRLGEADLGGKGGPQDIRQAYLWLTLATKQNIRAAERERNEVLRNKRLTSDEVSQLETTAVRWRPKEAAVKNPAIIP